MNILDTIIHDVTSYVNSHISGRPHTEYTAKNPVDWETAEKNNIVLLPDLGVELGHPDLASVSFLSWTPDSSLVNDDRITLIGRDIQDAKGSGLPFGKIVIAGINGLDDQNVVARNREMFFSKFDISLKGYMVRAASSYMAEWCRISNDAVEKGLSFKHIGSALIQELKKLDYVTSAEVIFITSSADDVNGLFDMGNRAVRTVNALSKMVNEMNYECDECEFQDICDDAEELMDIRNTLEETS